MTDNSCKGCNSSDPFIEAERQVKIEERKIEEDKKREELQQNFIKKQEREYKEWEEKESKKATEMRYNLVSNGKVLKENLTSEEQNHTITQWGIDTFNKKGSITAEDIMNLVFEPIIKEEPKN